MKHVKQPTMSRRGFLIQGGAATVAASAAYTFTVSSSLAQSKNSRLRFALIDNGILFEGELGRIFVNRGKLVGKPIDDLKAKPLPEDAVARIYRGMPMVGNDRPAHWADFIHSIEHRTQQISDVHSHMKMLNVCHLAGICCRLGRTVHWDQATEMITGDDLAAAMMSRPYREAYRIEI